MIRAREHAFWRGLVLLAAVLAAGMPTWGTPTFGAGARVAPNSCCLDPEPSSCCAPKQRPSGPSVSSLCCGLGELPRQSPETDGLPRVLASDPTARILSEHAFGVLSPSLERSFDGPPASFADWRAFAPSRAPRAAHPVALHWVTDRESRRALAWLSIALL